MIGFDDLRGLFLPWFMIILPDGSGGVRDLLQDAMGETLGLRVGETASLEQRHKQNEKGDFTF